MIVSLDLHVHTAASRDGSMPLDEIIRRAKARGLQGIAVTDHDVFSENLPQTDDFLLIPGCEFSTKYGHLLGLFLTEPISPNKTFYQLAEAIHAQGGIAVLAHPFEHKTDAGRIDPIAYLLDGVEIRNGRATRKNPAANDQAEAWAEQYWLPGTCGSDAHVPQEIGRVYRQYEVPALTLEAVRDAILDPYAAREMVFRPGKRRWVAKSQLAKLRQSRAGLKNYLKWCAFAAKCCLEDLLERSISLRKKR